MNPIYWLLGKIIQLVVLFVASTFFVFGIVIFQTVEIVFGPFKNHNPGDSQGSQQSSDKEFKL